MSKRKWKNSGIPIASLSELMECARAHGGVWRQWSSKGRFESEAWIAGYQIQYALQLIHQRLLYYPELVGDGGVSIIVNDECEAQRIARIIEMWNPCHDDMIPWRDDLVCRIRGQIESQIESMNRKGESECVR